MPSATPSGEGLAKIINRSLALHLRAPSLAACPPRPPHLALLSGSIMANALTEKFSRLVKQMSGQARITESNVQDMLREVRMALLEADVALPVVRDFVARVKDKALGQEVLGSLKPGQALVGIVNRELAA